MEGMTEPTMPLRERNRRDTWRAIHAAAAELTLERGLHAVTVDDIAVRAGVSRRTLFNYFATKEDAVLGMQKPELTDAVIQAYRTSDEPQFERTLALVVAMIRSTFPVLDERPLRKQLMAAEPELEATFKRHFSEVEDIVIQTINERIGDADSQEALAALPHGAESARALFMLSASVIRFAAHIDPTALTSERSDALDHAVEVFRGVIQEAL